jgi:hypothetical protein
MFKKTAITLAAAGVATAIGLASAQAAPDSRMLGQSARAGASYDADMQNYYMPRHDQRMAGQSARAGTAYDVDMYEGYAEPYAPYAGQSARAGTANGGIVRSERAGYPHHPQAGWVEDEGMYPSHYNFDESNLFDRAARPNRQR